MYIFYSLSYVYVSYIYFFLLRREEENEVGGKKLVGGEGFGSLVSGEKASGLRHRQKDAKGHTPPPKGKTLAHGFERPGFGHKDRSSK
jgi:hypothetical protein